MGLKVCLLPSRDPDAPVYLFKVLSTRTAFSVGDVVVEGTVAVVTSGADVGSRQSKPLQGHPAEQFS